MSRSSMKVVLIISLAFNVAVAGAIVFAYATGFRRPEVPPPGVPHERLMMAHCRRIGRMLGLDDEQMRLFEERFAVVAKEREELRERLFKAREELFRLLSSSSPDEAAVFEKVNEISAIQGELEKLDVKRLLQMREVLKPEQRDALMEMLRCRMGPRDRCPGMRGMWHRELRKGGMKP